MEMKDMRDRVMTFAYPVGKGAEKVLLIRDM